MAVVLSAEENNYFSSAPLRRSHSQPKFGTKRSGFRQSSSASRIDDFYCEHPPKLFSGSSPSSAPSSPRTLQPESSEFSCSSTPASNFSLGSDCDDSVQYGSVQSDDQEQIILPQYDDVGFLNDMEDLDAPPSPLLTGDSYAPSPNEQDSSGNTSRPDSPISFERPVDDIAVRAQPSRHVDYLSHNWREEDIWSSWKLIVSNKNEYSNAARLENASWRTWMKSKNKLKTISPETLNW
jgi:hypothetical protein